MKISRKKWYSKLDYKPRRGQAAMDKAVYDGYRYIGFFAFPRAGKSFGAARHVGLYLLNPDNHGWIVAPTYALGAKEFGYIWNDLLTTGFLARAKSRSFDVRGGNMSIEFDWGSFVRVVSADNPTSLRAEELDWLILAEASAMDASVYERHLYTRTEKRHGLVLVPTTPKGHNWVYHNFYIPSQPTLQGKHNLAYVGKPYWGAIISADPELGDIYEPGVFDEETVARAKQVLPPAIYREQFGGEFASYAGLVYSDYSPRVLIDPFPIPDWWVHVVGYDAGANDPTAIILGSWSPEGIFYVWGEIYTKGYSAAQYAHLLRHLLGTRAPTAIVRDPTEAQLGIELQQVGMFTQTPHTRQVEARIMRVTGLIRDGKLRILRGRAPNLEEEFVSYEWDEANPKHPRKNQREHALDALGYAVLWETGLPELAIPDIPYRLPGEDLDVAKLWKKVRQMDEKPVETVVDSPFEEDSLVVEDYRPGW